MDQNENTYTSPEHEEIGNDVGFFDQLGLMPNIMQKRFFRQIGASLVVALLTLVIMIYFKSWSYSIGLLLSLYLAYAGFDLIWGFHSGKIICKKVVVLKANLQKEYVAASLRELDENGKKTDELHQLRLYGKRTEIAMIESNVVLEIYFRPNYTADVIAWEIVDYAG